MTDAPTPPSTDLPLDSHVHTDHSHDSTVVVDAYAALAEEHRIAELAITDHVDFDPRAPGFEYVPFDVRERTVRDAAERWADRGVAIRFGVEVTYDSRWEDEIRDHLKRHRYDFVIGSVHIAVDSPYARDRIESWATGRPLTEVMRPWFDEVTAAARSGLFDTLGHIDFVKRFLDPLPAQLAAAPELYEPALEALVATGTALEINSSGLRTAAKEPFPALPIVERFRELGGVNVTAGSDTHLESTFAFGLEEGYRVAAAAGYGELLFRRGGDPVAVALPGRVRQGSPT